MSEYIHKSAIRLKLLRGKVININCVVTMAAVTMGEVQY